MTIFKKWLICAAAAASMAGSSIAMAQCAQFPGCLYRPPQLTFSETGLTITYPDIPAVERAIKTIVRQPAIPAGPLPVVSWSHGGAEGHTNARTALREWSELTARSGYLTVSIAHSPRDPGQWSDLCIALGITVPAD